MSDQTSERYSDQTSERRRDAEIEREIEREIETFCRSSSCGVCGQDRFESLSTCTCATPTHRIEAER